MPNLRTVYLSALAAVLIGGAVYPLVRKRPTEMADAASAPVVPHVQAALVETRSMDRTVRLGGVLKSGMQASLSPKQGGRVLSVPVRVGQQVSRGQLLVQLDDSDMRRQAEQAAAGARAARANLEKAREGLRLKQVDVDRRVNAARRGVEQAKLQVERAEAGIKVQQRASNADVDRAQAGLDAARAALAQAKRGARPEQRKQAQLQLQSAERGAADARKSLDDVEYLYQKGGLPRVKLDEARRGHERALDGVAQAKAQLELLNAGAGAEEIAAAEAQVRQAEAGVTAAKAGANRDEVSRAEIAAAQSQLRQAEDGVKTALATRDEMRVAQQDVRAAQAAYEQASAAAALAGQQLASARITSPAAGTVTAVNVDPGELAGPGMPAVTVTGTGNIYMEAAVPSRLLAQLRAGQTAKITVDALGKRALTGTVRSVSQTAGPDGRSFPVEIELAYGGGTLTAGAAARAEIQVESFLSALTVPVTAIHASERTSGQPSGDASTATSTVWVVRDRKLVLVPVNVAFQDAERAVVQGDLKAGEPVLVTVSAGLRAGDEVDFQIAKGL